MQINLFHSSIHFLKVDHLLQDVSDYGLRISSVLYLIGNSQDVACFSYEIFNIFVSAFISQLS